MEIRISIETVSGNVARSTWEEATPEDLTYLRETYREGIGNITALTLATVRGPLYINPAHIVAISIEERMTER